MKRNEKNEKKYERLELRRKDRRSQDHSSTRRNTTINSHDLHRQNLRQKKPFETIVEELKQKKEKKSVGKHQNNTKKCFSPKTPSFTRTGIPPVPFEIFALIFCIANSLAT